MSSAAWAAIAASFAALSAFMTMLSHRRNRLDSVRPGLVLTGWDRLADGHADSAHEVIAFHSIRSVGRGLRSTSGSSASVSRTTGSLLPRGPSDFPFWLLAKKRTLTPRFRFGERMSNRINPSLGIPIFRSERHRVET